LHDGFSNCQTINYNFNNIDTAYFCIGVYTEAVSNDVFKKITVDFALTFADILKANSPKATLCFLSGAGADQTEKSRIAFVKFKGMAELFAFQKL